MMNNKDTILISISARFFAKYIGSHINGKYIELDVDNKGRHLEQNIIDMNLIKDKNIIIVGFYNPGLWDNVGHYKDIIKSSKSTIIYFVGFDVEQLINPTAKGYVIKNKLLLKNFFKQNSNKIRFISENKYQSDIMKNSYGIDVKIIPMPIKNYNILTTCINFPKDKLHIGVYAPSNRELYNFDIIMDVIKQSPDYIFYLYWGCGFKKKITDVFPSNVILYEDETPINIIYNKINCGIRITNTDGMPQTGVEMLMMGKYFIYNHEMIYANYVKNDKNIVQNIINELDKINMNLEFNENASNHYKIIHNLETFRSNITSLFNEMT